MTRGGIPGRHGREWWAARDACLKGATMCHVPGCLYPGQPLVFGGPRSNPLRATADHLFPVHMTEGWTHDEKRRVLNDPAMLRPAHAACNSARHQGRLRNPPPARRSRDWGV